MKTHVRVVVGIMLALLSALSYAQGPVPFVNLPLVPDATAPGGPQFTLTVNGTGFVSGSVVNWNGNALATQFVSASQLTATVPAADIATASTASVTVVTPAPGGGTSNVVFFPVTVSTRRAGFGLASTLVSNDPLFVAVGDLNGDGKLDLVFTGNGGNVVSIELGDGAGNFTPASSPVVGGSPAGIAVGDFNGDGKLDLAIVNEGDNTVSVLLGDGTGGFTLASSPPVGSSPFGIAVGDFNGDGKLDLATGNMSDCTVSVLLGDGTGNFKLASSPNVGVSPWGIAVGDFNGDGHLDFAVVNLGDNTVSVLLGDGAGNFTLASSPVVGYQPISVAAGDFNGDGNLDLAVSNWMDGDVSILLGDGTGNFTLASSPYVPYPIGVAVGDFNGDGKLDLAVADDDGAVYILLGDGQGNFLRGSSSYVPNSQPYGLTVGDFDGDGKLDLATANNWSNTVSVLLAGTPSVLLSPTSLTFGPQLIGTRSMPQIVTLTNRSGARLDISQLVTSANFSQTNNCPRQIPPGGTCTANVVFSPHNINTITGTITITDNAPNSPQTVSLTGVGAAVSLLPSSLNFGSQQVGTTSQPQTVTLTNYASKAVTISGGDFAGRNPASFKLQNTTCQHSLPAGGSCTINIAFAPQRTGAITATLEVSDNGGASPQIVLVSGTGT